MSELTRHPGTMTRRGALLALTASMMSPSSLAQPCQTRRALPEGAACEVSSKSKSLAHYHYLRLWSVAVT